MLHLPQPGQERSIDLLSIDSREQFVVHFNRKGKVIPNKYTLLERHASSIVLLRLDVEGPPHINPDGEEIACPHIHISKEEYGTSWAYPADDYGYNNTSDIVATLITFLEQCRVVNITEMNPTESRGLLI